MILEAELKAQERFLLTGLLTWLSAQLLHKFPYIAQGGLAVTIDLSATS